MLLNRIPVLDKGYVALISSHNNGLTLEKLSLGHTEYHTLGRLTLAIKCPLFLQLNLGKFNMRIISMSTSKVEAFLPDMTDIGASDRETAEVIADDIVRTTEALLINPKAYQQDGCDKFISEVLTPISVYNELVVDAPLSEWIKFIQQDRAPKPIRAYQGVIKDIINNEWKSLNL